jgi:peptidoglycan/LPS O-acetylase OafA/YrhL
MLSILFDSIGFDSDREMSNGAGKLESRHQGHIPGLDGIRALAIGLVLFSHSVIYDNFSYLSPIGPGAGYAGVAVFFVLSGFLITTLLLREEERMGCVSLRLFYVRRALRLFPALWLYLLIVGLIWIFGRLPHHPWHSFVTSVFYVRNLVGRGHETDHLWSLSIEEQFYLLWPLVMVGLRHRHIFRLMISLSVLVSITIWRVHAARTGLATTGALYIRTDFRFDAPLFGCALALLLQAAPPVITWMNSSPYWSGLLTVTGTLGLISWIGLRLSRFVYPGIDVTIIYLFGLTLILSQMGARGWVGDWLACKPLVSLGKVSYGVYLWQQLFLGPSTPGFERIRVFPHGLIATFLVALVSYWCLEKPLLRIKDRRFHKFPDSNSSLAHVTGMPARTTVAA